MSFNIEKTLTDMVKSAGDVLSDQGLKAKGPVEQVLRDHKEALQEIAEARIKGDIDDDDLKDQLKDEQQAFQAGLSMVRAEEKATVQDAMNIALDTFRKAVRAAL
jgi:hypothetical protein